MRKILYLLILILGPYTVYAQNYQIQGIVKDSKGEAIIGASIAEKGTSNGCFTEADGSFAIKVSPGAMLTISYLGYITQEVVITQPSTNIAIRLIEDSKTLDDVVVIGYGTIRKSDLTGAVSSIGAKDLMSDVATSVAGAMQGKVPGVSVTNISGDPGNGMSINIRGISSLTGANSPLYVIDGVYGDINMADPADIVSMEILKDASSAAIYGSRAANGVVLITTKGGKKNSPTKIDFNAFTGVQQLAKKISVMDGPQWVDFLKSKGSDYIDGSNYAKNLKGNGTDWQDELYRSAAVYKANLGVSGGTESSLYNATISYLNQDGIVLNTGYEAINARLKTEFSFFSNRLKIGESLIFKSGKKYGTVDVQSALRVPAIVPVHDDTRNYGWGAVESWMENLLNPVGNSMVNDNSKEMMDVLLNLYGQIELTKGLKYKLNYGLTQSQINYKNLSGVYDFGSGGINTMPDLNETSEHYKTWIVENTLTYDNTFGKHTLSGLLGISAQKDKYNTVYTQKSDLFPGQTTMGNQSDALTSGSAYVNTLASFFTRVMYSYDSRYMLSASVRTDGSSKFDKGYNWGSFPSFSVGWNIHNESFSKGLDRVLNELKLRYSYGELGNNQISNYLTQRYLAIGMNYVQGDKLWIGGMPGVDWISPENLTWEKTRTSNIGLDAAFLKNKFQLSVDYYTQNTRDVLMPFPVPPSAGLRGTPWFNAGTIENKGLEVAITHRNNIGKVFYNLSGTISTVNNKVKKINIPGMTEIAGYNPQGEGTITWMRVGDPMGVFRVIKTDGIFQSQSEIDAYVDKDGNKIQPNATVGDIKFIDYNGDGKIADDDRQTVGKPIPDISFGLRGSLEYNGFDLNFFFDGVAGNSIYNFARWRIESMRKYSNYSTDVLNAWTPENHSTTMPRYDIENKNQNGRAASDRWIEKGDFIRLKTLEFGYVLPKITYLDKVRLYLSFENLFTITKYKGYTPDLGYNSDNAAYNALSRGTDHGRYPLARTFSFGIQIGL
ncbi:MAG: TonB-dependent receptor [Prevotella sp.]|jgi:TonB-linked SusC/RagA family outer membrane protein|nr:TonB-dependent receptor [Prevotella sp.]